MYLRIAEIVWRGYGVEIFHLHITISFWKGVYNIYNLYNYPLFTISQIDLNKYEITSSASVPNPLKMYFHIFVLSTIMGKKINK